MTNNQNSKPPYDLEEWTFLFSKDVKLFVKTLPKTIANIEDSKQVVRASGSVELIIGKLTKRWVKKIS